MESIYLDNAATTPMLPKVIDTVTKAMETNFGNPSSTHKFGRSAKAALEMARKKIASYFNAKPNEIYFTAGGSEADNLILKNAVVNLGVKTIISSKIEHHAVLHTIEFLQKKYNIEVIWLNLDERGTIDYQQLETVLKQNDSKKLVSLMYVNNEIGNILDVSHVSQICSTYKALFHTDAVQAVGHFTFDVVTTPIDFFAASAHKFHGPKGVGFAYISNKNAVNPLLHGGEQERGARAGTENLHSILGMEKALELAYENLAEDTIYIQKLKNYFIEKLIENFEDIDFNGTSQHENKSSYIMLNARFPKNVAMLLFNLDLKGIAVSGGSACQSGSNKGSHVLNEILNEEQAKHTSVRFSFSKLNTKAEIDYVIKVLKTLVK
ncbi:MAG TPA: cysteine desulfurase family protein [Flavobacteriaceae bacterium]|nr:cysteine desulfurase family protein [Flavobacteriaceae bacterium]